MSKTAEELATEYASNNHDKSENHVEWLAAYNGFIAGYYKDTANIIDNMNLNHSADVSKMVVYEEKIKELNDVISGLSDDFEGMRSLWLDAQELAIELQAQLDKKHD